MESRKRERERGREVSCDVPQVAYLQVREWRVVILVHTLNRAWRVVIPSTSRHSYFVIVM